MRELGALTYVEREAVGEAERAEEADALALGAGAAVADDDGAAHHRGAAARGEDLRCCPSRRLRLRQPYRPHRRLGSPFSPAQGSGMGGGAGCVVPAGSSAARGGAVEWISEWEACLAKQVCFCICSLFFRRPFASVASGFAACPAGGGRREPPGRGRRRRRRGADGDANLWGGLLGFVLNFAYWACLVVARNEQRLSVFHPLSHLRPPRSTFAPHLFFPALLIKNWIPKNS